MSEYRYTVIFIQPEVFLSIADTPPYPIFYILVALSNIFSIQIIMLEINKLFLCLFFLKKQITNIGDNIC